MKAEVKKAKMAQKKVRKDIEKQRKAIENQAKAMLSDTPGAPAPKPGAPKQSDAGAQAKAKQLMEFFAVPEEHTDKVLAWVMVQAESATMPELTNLFIDQVLPGLSMK